MQASTCPMTPIQSIILCLLAKSIILCFYFSFLAASQTCQQVRDSSRPLIGTFRPQCEDDGIHYKQTQFHGSSGYSWCVHPLTGEEIEGNKIPPGAGTPHCRGTTNEWMNYSWWNCVPSSCRMWIQKKRQPFQRSCWIFHSPMHRRRILLQNPILGIHWNFLVRQSAQWGKNEWINSRQRARGWLHW